jgi:[acyl-carrier-protein] S-malonyltransferase
MSKAFIFPGQGSQTVGMGSDFYEQSSVFKSVIERASAALDYDLWEIIANNPDEKLNQTEYTQPALLAVSSAIYQCVMEQGKVRPSFFAGHSLGEYSALVAAGSITLEDAVTLVRSRGQFMQQAVPEGKGAMAAVLGLEEEVISKLCLEVEGVVEAANLNAPGQIVIAGSKEAVQSVLPVLKDAGAKRALELPVSVPSHCSLMKPAAEMLEALLVDVSVSMPTVPVIHNVTARAAESTDEIKARLVEQLYSPVRWVDCVVALKEAGVEGLVECGAGKVLTGLVKRIDRSLPCVALNSVSVLDDL